MNTKNLVVIPLRANSTRLSNKNTLTLGELPLFMHSVNYARANSDIVDKILITTNDEVVKEVAKKFNIDVLDRPSSISGEFEPTITALQHVVNVLEEDFENIILLQATNPLRPKNLLKDAFSVYKNKKCSSLMTVSQIEKKLGRVTDNIFIPYNYTFGQRSQDIAPLFYENGLLYITNVELIKKGEIIGADSYPYIVDHIFSTIDIDTNDDFELAKYYINKFDNE